MKSTLSFILLLAVMINCTAAPTPAIKRNTQSFKITALPAENGSYIIEPALPADGLVVAGTKLTIKATPAKGYSIDATFYTFKGGMWGTTSIENFSTEMIIEVDKDKSVGASFVETALVKNLSVKQNIVYAKPGVKPLKYDVYSPKGAKQLPCIVIVHGGGWSSNNEDVMRGLARELTKDGKYVVVSIDYRWVNKLDGDAEPTSMHQLIEDVFGAIAHIREHAADYGIDPNNIAVTGDSAGGHLSASAATLSPLIGDRGFGKIPGVYEFLPTYMPSKKTITQVRNELIGSIKAVAPSYGPTDAADFKMFIQQTDPGYLAAVSPVMHIPNVKNRPLPNYIVRGTKDPLISAKMIQQYVDTLTAAGQTVERYEIDGASHAFFDWKPDAFTMATFRQYGVPYAAKMKTFFDKVFYAGKIK